MATCQSDYAAYEAALVGGGSTAAAYNAMDAACQQTAAALAPVKPTSAAAPADIDAAQAAAAALDAAVAELPDLTVRSRNQSVYMLAYQIFVSATAGQFEQGRGAC